MALGAGGEPMAARFAAIDNHPRGLSVPGHGERWLDVGTGTGAVALRAARARARVTGVDLSPVMVEFDEGELQLTAGSGEEMWRLFTSYDGVAKAQVDSLQRPRAQEYRRAFIAYHERHRANGRISLPRRYLLTLGRRRGG